MTHPFRFLILTAAVGLVAAVPGSIQAQPKAKPTPSREGIEFFESKIRPVLVNKCFECHSVKASKVRAALYLDSRDGILKGGDSGPAIIPGDPGKSLLIKSLRHLGDVKMPPKEKLPASVIADFEQWVRMGAPDPRTNDAAAWKKLSLEEAKSFWSFKPLQKPNLPMIRDTSWPRAELDRFILHKMEQRGLKAVADADRVTLIRRLSFDLVGLPPTTEEIDDFVNDKSANAVEKLVDRLLASPRFGERWGRYWLDIARYAESNGNTDNTPFPHAWRYRDYVIKAFNEDRPYNRFITEQIAGDLLPAKSPAERDELLTATGFLALTSKPRAQNNPDYRMDLIADQIDVTTKAVLALTALCARCHDHKFDPISQKEYYSLAGIFDSSNMLAGGGGKGAKKGGGEGLHTLSTGGQAMGITEAKPVDTALCIRGDSTKRGEVSPRGFLKVAVTEKTQPVNRSQSGRLELAQWLTQPDNPLTARVMANRIWQHLFGQGICRSPDNFGLLGELPSHPELLDHLATRFIEDGWSVKKLIRYIVLSRTYQLSSNFSEANYKADPDNILWWRSQPRRLDAEAIRDAMLFVSNHLIPTPPGKSLANGVAVAKKKAAPPPKDSNYRSVYLPIIRNNLPESLAIFDVADPSLVIGQREVTTVPAQALYLMNSPFVLEQARGLAQRVLNATASDDSARIDLAFRIALGRVATTQERERTLQFLQEAQRTLNGAQARASAWTAFCQTLLASAEFRYLQ